MIVLLKALTQIAGPYSPSIFSPQVIDELNVIPPAILRETENHWSDHLVGLFLDATSSYSVVHEHCRRAWKLKGSIHLQFLNSFFFFKLGNKEDRLIALDTSPLIIKGKPFIVTSWSVGIDGIRERILSILVKATFTDIPSVLQSLIDLNPPASLIKNFKCFDANTVAHKNLLYVGALIEITLNNPLPSKLKLRIVEGHAVDIKVNYSWKPDICSIYHSFDHTMENCYKNASLSPPDKIPLPRIEMK